MGILAHLINLHAKGSSNPLGLSKKFIQLNFHPFHSSRDVFFLLTPISLLVLLSGFNSVLLGDPDNFFLANPMVTPLHIQPEWYFLHAYAILRSVPSKAGGVLLIALSFLVLLIHPALKPMRVHFIRSSSSKLLHACLLTSFVNLIWLGSQVPAYPFSLARAL